MSDSRSALARALDHPPGLSTLFFTEMWERFSYYGMRAILTLFMLAPASAGGLGMRPEESGPIYAMYTSLVFLMCIPGGWIADNLLGQRRSVLYGGIVIMMGHILLAMHGLPFFYAGLGCVILGTGLLKPNISAIVGQLYEENDDRRDSGFSIFYMGINLGAFTAPLVCGFLAQHPWFQERLASWGMNPSNSWHWGFGAAAVGMFLGLVQYVTTGYKLGEAGLRPAPVKSPEDQARRKRTFVLGVILFTVLALSVVGIAVVRPGLITSSNIDYAYRVVLFAVVIGFFGRLFLAGDWTRAERNRLFVIVILFAAAAVFWGVLSKLVPR
jgi:POT family proton-dependent oligopeptide transporter